MNEPTPTPGPWQVVGLSDGRIGVIGAVNGLAVCQVKQSREISEPNARLIAASPDLLAACEAVLDWLGDDPFHDQPTSLYGQLRTAVAKARGGAA